MNFFKENNCHCCRPVYSKLLKEKAQTVLLRRSHRLNRVTPGDAPVSSDNHRKSIRFWKLRRQPGIKPGCVAFRPYLSRKRTLVFIPVHGTRATISRRTEIDLDARMVYTFASGKSLWASIQHDTTTPSCNNRNGYYRYYLVNPALSITRENRRTTTLTERGDGMKRTINRRVIISSQNPHETSFNASSRALNHSDTYIYIHIYIQLSSSHFCEVIAKFIYDMRLYVVDVYL